MKASDLFLRSLEEELQRSKEVARFGMTSTLSTGPAGGSMAPLTATGTVLEGSRIG